MEFVFCWFYIILTYEDRLVYLIVNKEKKRQTETGATVYSILHSTGSYRRSRDSSVGIVTGYGLDDQGEREFKSR
jgi:hypothetical protein